MEMARQLLPAAAVPSFSDIRPLSLEAASRDMAIYLGEFLIDADARAILYWMLHKITGYLCAYI